MKLKRNKIKLIWEIERSYRKNFIYV